MQDYSKGFKDRTKELVQPLEYNFIKTTAVDKEVRGSGVNFTTVTLNSGEPSLTEQELQGYADLILSTKLTKLGKTITDVVFLPPDTIEYSCDLTGVVVPAVSVFEKTITHNNYPDQFTYEFEIHAVPLTDVSTDTKVYKN